jgi:transposase
VRQLPEETRRCVGQELELLDTVQVQIGRLEERIRERTQPTASMRLLKSLPGVGDILAIVIDRELGTIHRFSSNVHFASYSGVVPRVSSSGGKYRYGRMVKQANNYLKWAFIEAANAVVRQRHHPRWQQKHVSVLYERTRRRKGDAVAVGAVARHLAEATFWVLTKGESYQEPREVLPKQGQARG